MAGSSNTNDPQLKDVSYHQLFMIAFTIIIALITTASILPAWSVRCLVAVAFILQISYELKLRHASFLKSPAFLLSAVACFGYSLYLSITIYIASQSFMENVSFIRFSDIIPNTSRLDYLGHKAEMYVLGFAILGLSIHVTTGLIECAQAFSLKRLQLSPNLYIPLTTASLVLTLIGLGANYFDFFGGVISHFLSGAYPPIQAFIVLLMLHLMLTHKLKCAYFWVASISVIIFLLVIYSAKMPFYLIISIVFYYIYIKNVDIFKISKYIIILMILFTVIIQISEILRTRERSILHGPNISISPETSAAAIVFTKKTIWRQLETGNCFRIVVNQHEDDKFEWHKQLFWIQALIPRIIWPDKENLSLGTYYEIKYCDLKSDRTLSRHSASITLLGQPMIKGGDWGLILHGGILLIGLGALTLIARFDPGLGSVYVMALLPWWIDFDQDYALYVANIVKFSLFMSIVGLPVFLSQRLAR